MVKENISKKTSGKRVKRECIDPPELIKKCLSCKKPSCRNCIGSMTTEQKYAYVHV